MMACGTFRPKIVNLLLNRPKSIGRIEMLDWEPKEAATLPRLIKNKIMRRFYA